MFLAFTVVEFSTTANSSLGKKMIEKGDNVVVNCSLGSFNKKEMRNITWHRKGILGQDERMLTLNGSYVVEEKYKGRIKGLSSAATETSRAIQILNVDHNFISSEYWCEISPRDLGGGNYEFKKTPFEMKGMNALISLFLPLSSSPLLRQKKNQLNFPKTLHLRYFPATSYI